MRVLLFLATVLSFSSLALGQGATGPDGGPPVIPEPSSLLVWGGLIAVGGLLYWYRKRR